MRRPAYLLERAIARNGASTSCSDPALAAITANQLVFTYISYEQLIMTYAGITSLQADLRDYSSPTINFAGITTLISNANPQPQSYEEYPFVTGQLSESLPEVNDTFFVTIAGCNFLAQVTQAIISSE